MTTFLEKGQHILPPNSPKPGTPTFVVNFSEWILNQKQQNKQQQKLLSLTDLEIRYPQLQFLHLDDLVSCQTSHSWIIGKLLGCFLRFCPSRPQRLARCFIRKIPQPRSIILKIWPEDGIPKHDPQEQLEALQGSLAARLPWHHVTRNGMLKIIKKCIWNCYGTTGTTDYEQESHDLSILFLSF